ncbi:IclR family transcriptional regulator [Pseudodesulfovibrio pelocollis]|uniref:IclR family transcriptional regulator n=1 Tax=Pseudodesulfovibrio pelocollis TaxID=3051432 RepID=UPI00255AB997|nr:IclR family transcriptional regulator [Pseudodesulfovibrio sp. SB368]
MSKSQRRVLRIQKVLKGRSLTGLSNGEIARALDESPANICRALAVMQDEGAVTRLETGRWALGIAILQLAQAHANEMADTQGRLLEINRRVAAGAAL